MHETRTHFYADGLRLEASWYAPDGVDLDRPLGAGPDGWPVVIVCSGYQGFNSFYPRLFASALTELGYLCLGFDYRGFADSEGQKGRVLIEEQVSDVRHALAFARAQEGVDAHRIGLLGWGMGAANVVLAAERTPQAAAVAALNGFYDGVRWLQSTHTYDEWVALTRTVEADRRRRSLTGVSELGDTFLHYPLDPATSTYVGAELAGVHGFGHPTTVQFAESIMDLKAERSVAHLDGTPLFVAHGVDNTLHPIAEAESLYAAATSPKRFLRLRGRHNDFMYADHPVFVDLCDHLDAFFSEAFTASAHPALLTTG